MQRFVEDVKKNAIEYGSIPFWSWNDKLEEKELRRQINVMHDLGMKGFFMHARGGLETEYLSEEWYVDGIAVIGGDANFSLAAVDLSVFTSGAINGYSLFYVNSNYFPFGLGASTSSTSSHACLYSSPFVASHLRPNFKLSGASSLLLLRGCCH